MTFQGPIPKAKKHGRVKPKYNPTPTAREKAFHQWAMQFPCACGCGQQSTVVHHPLTRHPEQRWRRDHEYVVPMNGFCHMDLHRAGHERDEPFTGLAVKAYELRWRAIDEGRL